MNETITLKNAPKADAEYESAIDNLIEEMQRVREHMAQDQHEIERLRAETQVILKQMKAS